MHYDPSAPHPSGLDDESAINEYGQDLLQDTVIINRGGPIQQAGMVEDLDIDSRPPPAYSTLPKEGQRRLRISIIQEDNDHISHIA